MSMNNYLNQVNFEDFVVPPSEHNFNSKTGLLFPYRLTTMFRGLCDNLREAGTPKNLSFSGNMILDSSLPRRAVFSYRLGDPQRFHDFFEISEELKIIRQEFYDNLQHYTDYLAKKKKSSFPVFNVLNVAEAVLVSTRLRSDDRRLYVLSKLSVSGMGQRLRPHEVQKFDVYGTGYIDLLTLENSLPIWFKSEKTTHDGVLNGERVSIRLKYLDTIRHGTNHLKNRLVHRFIDDKSTTQYVWDSSHPPYISDNFSVFAVRGGGVVSIDGVAHTLIRNVRLKGDAAC
jgi:hypothetical protein